MTTRHITLLVRAVIILVSVLAGWSVWYSARWLVWHDEIYLRLHDAGFGLVTDSAEIFATIGFFPAIIGGLVFGAFATLWITRLSRRLEAR